MRVLRVTENKLIYLVLVNGYSINLSILYLFYLYIYASDSQESNGGANTSGRQLPRPASEDAKILLSA